jgi:hypothetical protein
VAHVVSRRKNRGHNRLVGRDGTISERLYGQLAGFRPNNERVQQDVICDNNGHRAWVVTLSLRVSEDTMTLNGRHATWHDVLRPDGGYDVLFWCPRADCPAVRLTPSEPLEQRLREAKEPGKIRRLSPIRLRDM